MNLIETYITNNTKTNQSYSWFTGGLYLSAGQTIRVPFEPLTLLNANKGKQRLCAQDLLSGRVAFAYKILAPAEYKGITKAPATIPLAPVTPVKAVAPHVDSIDKIPSKASADTLTPDNAPEDMHINVVAPALKEPPVISEPTEEPDFMLIADPTFIAPKVAEAVEEKTAEAVPAEEVPEAPAEEPPKVKATRNTKKKKSPSTKAFF